jgi:hypothetical protein
VFGALPDEFCEQAGPTGLMARAHIRFRSCASGDVQDDRYTYLAPAERIERRRLEERAAIAELKLMAVLCCDAACLSLMLNAPGESVSGPAPQGATRL